MLLLRQWSTLLYKNLLVVLVRHPFSTPLRCFLLPVIYIVFLAYARNLFLPPSEYGIGETRDVKSLQDALRDATGGRDTVAFVHNGFLGGDIEGVIDDLSAQVQSAGKTVQVLPGEEDLITTCRSSIRGVSSCYGAAVFYGSPSEGPGGIWNYTLRADGGLASKIVVTSSQNDVQLYPLPLQHAVDFSIALRNSTVDQSALPSVVQQFTYTSKTQDELDTIIRTRYMGGIIEILGVAFFIGVVGVIYQFVGLMASERELGMTQLIDASLPNTRRWEPQAVRFLAYHSTFDILFLPGWIAIALILGFGVFTKTSVGILIIFNIIGGLSLSSFSLFGAAFFHKAQLSGIITTIASLLLAVLAQVIARASTGAIVVLSILFPPMNYTFFTVLVARWERKNLATNLLKSAPENPSTLPGIAFFVFAIIHVLAFPFLGAFVERLLYGTTSKGRQLRPLDDMSSNDVTISGFSKIYSPSWWARNIAVRFGKHKQAVTAVEDLSLNVPQGQILVLLGANGSGKSTTLDCIAGLRTLSSGSITIGGHGGIGICPQSNVMWSNLTAYEHVKIFNRLKSVDNPSTKAEMKTLIGDCDLGTKSESQTRALSGGQKRKLQLAMMLSGGARVCCVDEVSSGVDPLSRRSLWNILLKERGNRTIILSTHYLEEADLLSDQIAILAKGKLKAFGSSVELKHRLGEGFRVHVMKDHRIHDTISSIEGYQRKELIDQIVYTVSDSRLVVDLIKRLELTGHTNYEIRSPTVEEIFFNVAETLEQGHTNQSGPAGQVQTLKTAERLETSVITNGKDPSTNEEALGLETGRPITMLRQIQALFQKRWIVFQRNYLPSTAALLIPVIAAGLVTLFLKGFAVSGCAPSDLISDNDIDSLLTQRSYDLVAGPGSRANQNAFQQYQATLPGEGNTSSSALSDFLSNVHIVDSLGQFNDYVKQHVANVTPGGFFIGGIDGLPTFAYRGDARGGPAGTGEISFAVITQNALNNLLTNVSIGTQYQAFDTPWVSSTGKTLQLVVYFGLVLAAYPAMFSLYPTLERLRNVRQLHYSNGVRSISLWSAYLAFDFVVVLAASVLSIIIFRGVNSTWYHIEYLFVVLFLYGIASTLLSYVISLFSRSQLAAFAFAAGGQAVMFLLYFIAYLSVFTYSPSDKVDDYLLLTHFTFSIITPTGSLIRSLFIALNIFSTTCLGKQTIASYPGDIRVYGGPIVYLILQSVFLFGVLLWWDSGSLWARLRRKEHKSPDGEGSVPIEDEIGAEIKRVRTATDDGLRVEHITKAFGKNVAVQDVTFGVQHGEVFALLGPNGAGKSTTISLIRGDILPSHDSGEIYVEDIPVSKRRAAARNRIGVCPQFDCCDQMDVLQHLAFYARIRGVKDVQKNVREVVNAVGLEPFQYRMAAKLSGGNKRKLSLAIALMGNPSVLLLDEPSSGMDVLAKRVMWKTLASVAPGRSLVLTSHDMEEVAALSDRAGILGRKMLALGTPQELRRKHGNRYYVHLITKTAPHSSEEEMDRIKTWVQEHFEDADVEERTFHGQLRFSVPASQTVHLSEKPTLQSNSDAIQKDNAEEEQTLGGIGALFTQLEAHKEELGFEYYSVSPTTLDQVFLTIVTKHNIEEENYREAPKRRSFWKQLLLGSFCL